MARLSEDMRRVDYSVEGSYEVLPIGTANELRVLRTLARSLIERTLDVNESLNDVKEFYRKQCYLKDDIF
jgi:hypothetical protein